MLDTIAVVLVVLWALGYFAVGISQPMVHGILLLAVILLLVRVVRGGPPL